MGSTALVRHIGGYAALTDPSHRETLEKVLKVSAEVPAALARWPRGWPRADAAAIMLQPGIERGVVKIQEQIER